MPVNMPAVRATGDKKIDLPLLQRNAVGCAVFFGDELARYGFGGSHPWGTDRLYAFWNRLQVENIAGVVVQQPEIATEDAVLSFHEQEYVEFVKMASKQCKSIPLDRGDTPSFRGVFEATLHVVGSTLAALDMVMQGKDRMGRKIENAFVPIAGLHHARRDSAGGFCVFNDVGVAVMQARKKYSIKKIAYVDIDAHHGDGVFYEFEDDPLLFFADIHQQGIYPGTGFSSETGRGAAKDTKMNIPLNAYAGNPEFFDAFARVEGFVDSCRPELIFLNCGADSLAGDPITDLRYTARAHGHAADALRKIARKYCNGRLIAVGGGGYNRANIGAAWTEVVRALAGP
jgi:acetoin utilization protein AcuC